MSCYLINDKTPIFYCTKIMKPKMHRNILNFTRYGPGKKHVKRKSSHLSAGTVGT